MSKKRPGNRILFLLAGLCFLALAALYLYTNAVRVRKGQAGVAPMAVRTAVNVLPNLLIGIGLFGHRRAPGIIGSGICTVCNAICLVLAMDWDDLCGMRLLAYLFLMLAFLCRRRGMLLCGILAALSELICCFWAVIFFCIGEPSRILPTVWETGTPLLAAGCLFAGCALRSLDRSLMQAVSAEPAEEQPAGATNGEGEKEP